jgi:hypothetical protein
MSERPTTLQELRRNFLAAAAMLGMITLGAWAWVTLLTALH